MSVASAVENAAAHNGGRSNEPEFIRRNEKDRSFGRSGLTYFPNAAIVYIEGFYSVVTLIYDLDEIARRRIFADDMRQFHFGRGRASDSRREKREQERD